MTAPIIEDELVETESESPVQMDEVEVQAEVARLFERARSFTDTELSDRRAEAVKYYRGRPFGNEKKGRSQVVSTDLRDVVQDMLPSLMRLFMGTDDVVAFRPNSPETEGQAKTATAYVNHIFQIDNPGFSILYAALKDSLVKGLGILKWWWEDTPDISHYELTGLTPEEAAATEQDPTLELSEIESDPLTGLISMQVTRTIPNGGVKVAALEPEDFLFSENARDLDDALYVGHRTELRRGELIAMGISEEFLDAHGGVSTDAETNDEKIVRHPIGTDDIVGDEGQDADQLIMYVESYVYLDVDGDGINELRRIISIGTGLEIWENLEWTGRPFGILVPDPEPHSLLGLGMFDYLQDIQRIKSGVLRASLDSLAYAVNPRTVMVENQANYADVQNTEIGATIRVRMLNAVQEFTHSYVGKECFPMLEYMDQVREGRTGTSKASMGLDPDALQSSTRAAVAATVSGSRQHLELRARIFAETGITQMFQGILQLVVANQEKPRQVQLMGEANFAPIDPSPWDADMKVKVDVALGTDEERMSILLATSEKQAELLQTLGTGPENPMVTVSQYRNTLARMVEIGGFQPDLFFKKVPPDWQPPPPPPPPPTQEETFMMVEQMKAQVDVVTTAMKNQTAMMETLLREDRERDRIEVDAMVRLADIQAKSGIAQDASLIKMIMEGSRQEIEGARTRASAAQEEFTQQLVAATQPPAPQPPPGPAPAPQQGP